MKFKNTQRLDIVNHEGVHILNVGPSHHDHNALVLNGNNSRLVFLDPETDVKFLYNAGPLLNVGAEISGFAKKYANDLDKVKD